MNKEHINQSAFGVDFLDVEYGEKIVQIVSHKESAHHLSSLIVLTNRGSMYEIIGEKATRINPSLNVEEVFDEN